MAETPQTTPTPAKPILILPCDGTQELPVPAAAPSSDPGPLAMARRLVGLGFYPEASEGGPDWRKDLPCGGYVSITTNGWTDPLRLAYCAFGHDAEGVMRVLRHWATLDEAIRTVAAIKRFPDTPAEELAFLAKARELGLTHSAASHELGSRFFYGPAPIGRHYGSFTADQAELLFAAVRAFEPIDRARAAQVVTQ